ncbi:MAG: nucleotidyltransferase [Deltaproteobacteria bacterium HGW-Deltaproteobacteria-15]|jgi:uncharacterized protein with HEPN domain|nr:MAG: nucleotidyltransferase [Deltaproteobacteria bacterium HGW-Deltaproteobacteria-15]
MATPNRTRSKESCRRTAIRDIFLGDEMLQVWVVHHIEIIGEAASLISKEMRDQYSAIPWAHTVSMRNLLIHQYFGIDLDQVWDIVLIDLPKLSNDIRDILNDLAS